MRRVRIDFMNMRGDNTYFGVVEEPITVGESVQLYDGEGLAADAVVARVAESEHKRYGPGFLVYFKRTAPFEEEKYE